MGGGLGDVDEQRVQVLYRFRHALNDLLALCAARSFLNVGVVGALELCVNDPLARLPCGWWVSVSHMQSSMC